MDVHLRWMIRSDLAEAVKIESDVFEYPWSLDDFLRFLRQRNCIGFTAERDDRVVGFMIYELDKTKVRVLNFAVAREFQRRGVGRKLVEKLIGKLSPDRRTRITLEVRETNLSAQLFFRSMGFKAVALLRNFYEDTPEDAYLMQYRYAASAVAEACPDGSIVVADRNS